MTKTRRILVIDDAPTARAWMKHVLEKAGYEVLLHDGGLGVGAIVVREKPDLVLMDICMPTLNGDDIVSVLKKRSERAKEAVVVLYSSLPVEELQARAQACGADGYIRKTNNAAELVSQLELVLPG